MKKLKEEGEIKILVLNANRRAYRAYQAFVGALNPAHIILSYLPDWPALAVPKTAC